MSPRPWSPRSAGRPEHRDDRRVPPLREPAVRARLLQRHQLRGGEDREAALPTIYIEIGVAVARGPPLIVIAETSILASPALASATTIVFMELSNQEALRGVSAGWLCSRCLLPSLSGPGRSPPDAQQAAHRL